mmetsp:Transcript_18987/g.33413  ORF Transcript_18987/g.33413 Transcript_18987/m.33413 type:complete len:108 (-) Transcript_18987:63-386(-)
MIHLYCTCRAKNWIVDKIQREASNWDEKWKVAILPRRQDKMDSAPYLPRHKLGRSECLACHRRLLLVMETQPTADGTHTVLFMVMVKYVPHNSTIVNILDSVCPSRA